MKLLALLLLTSCTVGYRAVTQKPCEPAPLVGVDIVGGVTIMAAGVMADEPVVTLIGAAVVVVGLTMAADHLDHCENLN